MGKLILFQGDSVTDTRHSHEVAAPNMELGIGYPALVAARLLADYPERDYQFLNRGCSGNDIVNLYARWKREAINLKFDVVSILIGVNDTLHHKSFQYGIELERYERFYREIITWTRRELPQSKIMLCQPFVLNFGMVSSEWLADLAARGDITNHVAQEFGLPFVPFQDVINRIARRTAPERVLYDGVHPRLLGHQVLADAWLQVARSSGILA